MAVKGKKKSQARGSQGRRRPAAAPRARAAGHVKTPWYQTSAGRVGIAVGIVLVIASGAGAILAVGGGDDPSGESPRQQALQDYTDRLRTLTASVSGPVQEMISTPSDVSGAKLEALGKEAKGWESDFVKAAAGLTPLQSEPSMATTTSIFQQSVQLYGSAAVLYGIASRTEDSTLKDVLEEAGDTALEANALWQTGLTLLTEERAASGLAAPNLQTPSSPQAGAPPQQDTGAGGGGGSDQNGGGQNGGDKNGGDKKGASKKGAGGGSKDD